MSNPVIKVLMRGFALTCIVVGWASAFAIYQRQDGAWMSRFDDAHWMLAEHWPGIVLLFAGVSYLVLNPPTRRP